MTSPSSEPRRTREIERRFLVRGEPWRRAGAGLDIVQGYLARGERSLVRVRLAGGDAWLTIKSQSRGISRSEYEYPIPPEEGRALLELRSGGLVEKTRYTLELAGHVWEVDVFSGENAGLVLAEIELVREDEDFVRPDWLGTEVSHDPRYSNSSLAERPFSRWGR